MSLNYFFSYCPFYEFQPDFKTYRFPNNLKTSGKMFHYEQKQLSGGVL